MCFVHQATAGHLPEFRCKEKGKFWFKTKQKIAERTVVAQRFCCCNFMQ